MASETSSVPAASSSAVGAATAVLAVLIAEPIFADIRQIRRRGRHHLRSHQHKRHRCPPSRIPHQQDRQRVVASGRFDCDSYDLLKPRPIHGRPVVLARHWLSAGCGASVMMGGWQQRPKTPNRGLDPSTRRLSHTSMRYWRRLTRSWRLATRATAPACNRCTPCTSAPPKLPPRRLPSGVPPPPRCCSAMSTY